MHFSTYQNKLEAAIRHDDATEHTHRPALKALLEDAFDGIIATNEPKPDVYGAVDFTIRRREVDIGRIETKKVGENLEKIERGGQMKRYLMGYKNLILTDYLEFRWYVRGELRQKARLGSSSKDGTIQTALGGEEEVKELLTRFIQYQVPPIKSSKELAQRMAFFARIMCNVILYAFDKEKTVLTRRVLHEQLKAFSNILLFEPTPDQFADLYAQTICYGMFASRMRQASTDREPNTRNPASGLFPFTVQVPDDERAPFDRMTAFFGIQNPFLKSLFGYLAVTNTHPDVVWAINEVAALLGNADMNMIIKEFGRNKRQNDPVLHFYETFLAAYNPKLREARGIYYTPEPVVDYMVKSVDYILQQDFGLQGLADNSKVRVEKRTAEGKTETLDVHKVQILDPATGTGTFFHSIIQLVHQKFAGNQGLWRKYVKDHLIPRLFGFELLIAPYAITHLKLDFQLSDTGYEMLDDERLNIYLTNTLEDPQAVDGNTLFVDLFHEAKAATDVKLNAPVMAVLGNPPYSYESQNNGDWIDKLLRGIDTKSGEKTGSYYHVEGKPLGERNPKGLQDDYVKFFRFAQWRIEQTGYGVLAFVTNRGYLDNPTFRGMRKSLMETFDAIYVLDLHGSLKTPDAPDGTPDQNVFDIKQGVAIGIFVKHQPGKLKFGCSVKHAELWGPREIFEGASSEKRLTGGKYRWLADHNLSTTDWHEVSPTAPTYMFVPQDKYLLKEYLQGWALTDIMPVNSVGLYTARDDLTIRFTRDEVDSTIKKFSALESERAREHFDLGKDSSEWKVALAQSDVRASHADSSKIRRIAYRPLDYRYTYYTGNSRGYMCRPRPEIMNSLTSKENMALCFIRRSRTQTLANFFVAEGLVDKTILSSADNANVAPLYLYPDPNRLEYEPSVSPGGRRPNLAPKFIEELTKKLDLTFVTDGQGDLVQSVGPEDIFFYIYAVFHAPSYRTRYAEFLKSDFPRVPLISSLSLFTTLVAKGKMLTKLHLMKHAGAKLAVYPIGEGRDRVDKPRYEPPVGDRLGRIFINELQYFEGVPPEVWTFHIGGYQVCEKWIKDRRGSELSYDDIQHYQQLISVLRATIDLMTEIDEAVAVHNGWPLT